MGRNQLYFALVLLLNVLCALIASALNASANFTQGVTYHSKARSETANLYPLRRHAKREAPSGAGDHDENADIIPEIIENTAAKNVEQHFEEQVERMAKSFKQMWKSLEEAARDCAERLKSIFSGDDNAQFGVVGSDVRMRDYGNSL